jgi:Putative bacterial sensory transduction regulator
MKFVGGECLPHAKREGYYKENAMRYGYLAGLVIFVVTVPLVQAQEQRVFPALTPAQLESTLKAGKVEFNKIADKKANTFFYDFKAKAFNLRLYYLDGKQLLMDTLFPALPLEKLNDWNLGSNLSRAALGKDEMGGAFTVIGSQLSLRGGVTDGAIREFMYTFIEEVGQFQALIRDSDNRKEALKEFAFKELPALKLDKMLDDLKIKYAKSPLANGAFAYQYKVGSANVVLTNWGKDLMLEAKFPKMTLEKVNQYNVNRKFIRTVSYNNKNGEFTTLEANLNFQGGVTDSIVRNFISVFEEDVNEFSQYVAKKE